MRSPVQIPWTKRAALMARQRRLLRLVNFSNNVKIRFPRRQDVFAEFCETCSLCEEKGEEWVFGKLRDLFADHQDLIAEFVELQSAGCASNDGVGGSAGHEAFGELGNELAVLNTGEKPEIKGAKPTGTFTVRIKNAHELVLFDCEDDMCNVDAMIGLARSAMSRIGSHLAARRIEGCSLTPGELRCIRKMYGDRGADVVEIVGKDPARTLPLVLSRLQQKHDEWVAYRTDARKVWKKAFAEHRRPSLGLEDTNAIPVEATADAGRGTLCPPAEAGEEASEQAGLKFFGRPISWWERAAQKGSFSPLESFQ